MIKISLVKKGGVQLNWHDLRVLMEKSDNGFMPINDYENQEGGVDKPCVRVISMPQHEPDFYDIEIEV